MSYSLRVTSLVLGAALSVSVATAQIDFSKLRRPDPLWSVSIGARVYSGGAEVEFTNLGTIPVAATDLAGNRNYLNGAVNLDGLRSNEVDGTTQVSTPGERHRVYSTDADGNVTLIGNFVAFENGFTRDWGYFSADQVSADGRIAMDNYGSVSNGASLSAESDGSAGFDLNLTRRLGKLSTKVEWGLSVGLGLSDLKAQATGAISADLRRLTDFYVTRDGTVPDAPYGAPLTVDLLDADGNIVTVGGLETTTPLNLTPVDRTDTLLAGAANTTGEWELNGSYFIMRMGPSLRARLTKRVGVNVGAGVAAAYVGSTFRVNESFTAPDTTRDLAFQDEARTDELVLGFYGTATAEYWVTEATGFYGGASYEAFSDYEQTVSGRTATVDIGQGVAIRGGLVLRF